MPALGEELAEPEVLVVLEHHPGGAVEADAALREPRVQPSLPATRAQEILDGGDRLAVVGHVHAGQRVGLALRQRLHEGAVLAEEGSPVASAVGDDVADRPTHDGVTLSLGRRGPRLPTRASRGNGPRSPPRAAPWRRRCPPPAARGSSAARRTTAASPPASRPGAVGGSPRRSSRRRSPRPRAPARPARRGSARHTETRSRTRRRRRASALLIGLAGYRGARPPLPPPKRRRRRAAAASWRRAVGVGGVARRPRDTSWPR